MVKEKQNITGSHCPKGVSGKVTLDEKGIKDSWKEYIEKLMNEENELDHRISAGVKEGPTDCIGSDEVAAALKKMKRHKAPGLSGLIAEMIQATGDIETQKTLDLCNGIVKKGCIPEDWKSGMALPIYKGKGDPVGSTKVVERIFEHRIQQQINADDMQFGFMKVKGTTDVIIIIRQLQEKFRANGFVDLEKAFDRVPRELIRWAMHKSGVEEWLASAVMSM